MIATQELPKFNRITLLYCERFNKNTIYLGIRFKVKLFGEKGKFVFVIPICPDWLVKLMKRR